MSVPKEEITERQEDRHQKTMVIMIMFFFIGIVVFALSFFLVHIFKGKDANQITCSCNEMTGFKLEGDNGKVVTFPAGFKMEAGEELALETFLPDAISDDTWICYLSDCNTSVYVDGELRKAYDKNKDTIVGGALKRLHIFVELYPRDAGKKLRIVFYANRNNTVNIRPFYIGNSLGIIEQIISLDIVNFVLAFALLTISVIAIGIGLILRFSQKVESPITAMGVGVLFMTMWLIFDSALFQLAFRHYYIDGTMSYIMVLLIPYPFAYYLDVLQEHRYRMLYIFCLFYLEVVTVCACLLHFSGTVDFLTMLPFLAAAMGIILVTLVVTLVIDYRSKAYRTYFLSFIGMIGLLVSCVFEIIRVVAVDEKHVGTFVIIGLFWTIILAIIHQLYMVREAQKETAMAVRASETKTNFLANMSHEIRTPMNAILGMDEMILREAKGNEKITKYASDIKSAGNMLLSIINDILDLSKIESGRAELVTSDFEICSVINDLINIVKKRAEDKGLEFTFEAAEDIPVRYNGDEIRTRQIMLNIINNAVKYTESGYVKVSLDMERNDEKTEIREGDSVTLKFTVADSGIGIKEGDVSKLFQPFDRLEETKNRNIEGTGLGLSIAGTYVELMGGYIDVKSVYGEGSTFIVHIPVTVVNPSPIGDFGIRINEMQDSRGADEPLVIAPNASALVVDDNEMNLEVIAGLLERTKIRTDLAISGPECIKKLSKRRYDIVFLDQMMPGMDGITTLNKLRAEYDMRGVSVIALTADAVAGAREYYLENGFDDYISKPVKADALENILLQHLPKSSLLSQEDVDRITRTEEKTRQEKTLLQSMLVIDPDKDVLRNIKEKTEGIYKGTFVTDMEKAARYLEKHDADYVMVNKEIFMKQLDSRENAKKLQHVLLKGKEQYEKKDH